MYIEKHFLLTTFSLNCIQMRVFENGIGRSPRVALLEGQSILVVAQGLGRAFTGARRQISSRLMVQLENGAI
jgi:hypothetical protein